MAYGDLFSFRWTSFEMERMVTSNWISPKALFCLRAFECFYMWIVLIASWATAPSIDNYLMYLTHLSFFSLCVYLALTVILSFGYITKPHGVRTTWINGLNRYAGYLMWVEYETIVCLHIIVPVVYWSLLAGGAMSPLNTWLNVSQHALDGVVCISEIIFSRYLFVPAHVAVVVLIMLLYMCMAFVVHAVQGIWVYGFMDTSKSYAAVYYVGIAVVLILVFFLNLWIHNIKERVALQKKKESGQSDRLDDDSSEENQVVTVSSNADAGISSTNIGTNVGHGGDKEELPAEKADLEA